MVGRMLFLTTSFILWLKMWGGVLRMHIMKMSFDIMTFYYRRKVKHCPVYCHIENCAIYCNELWRNCVLSWPQDFIHFIPTVLASKRKVLLTRQKKVASPLIFHWTGTMYINSCSLIICLCNNYEFSWSYNFKFKLLDSHDVVFWPVQCTQDNQVGRLCCLEQNEQIFSF